MYVRPEEIWSGRWRRSCGRRTQHSDGEVRPSGDLLYPWRPSCERERV